MFVIKNASVVANVFVLALLYKLLINTFILFPQGSIASLSLSVSHIIFFPFDIALSEGAIGMI